MDTRLPNDPQFNKYYTKHCKYLKLKGLRPKTIDANARAIRRAGNYFDSEADNLTADQLLDYFHDLLESHSWSAVKLDLYGLKFFYTNVLQKIWQDIPLIKPPKTTRIPDIVTVEQANQLFRATDRLSYRVFFLPFTAWDYASEKGLNSRSAISIQRICGSMFAMPKGNKDRLVPLPEKTLDTPAEFLETLQTSRIPVPKP